MTSLYEPFCKPYYFGEDPMCPGFKHDDESHETTPGLTLQSAWDNIQQLASRGPVFLKDMPLCINHVWSPQFLSHITHAFLIRDPEKTITSYFHRNPDIYEAEIGFAEQRALFDLVTVLNNGTPPPVVESDDLLDDPEGIIMAFCEAVDIPYIPEALTFKPEQKSAFSAHVGWNKKNPHEYYHDNAVNSTGLKPQDRSKYIDMAEAPARIQQMYRRMLPHYKHLHQYRIA